MPLHGFRVVEFVDAGGTTRMVWDVVGEVRMGTVLGMLDGAKFLMLDDARREELDG